MTDFRRRRSGRLIDANRAAIAARPWTWGPARHDPDGSSPARAAGSPDASRVRPERV